MGPPRDLAIHPLGPGEIVDRSVALALRHFRPLFVAMLVIEAPALALARVQQARTAELLAAIADPVRGAAALPSLGATFALLLAVLLVLQLAATAAWKHGRSALEPAQVLLDDLLGAHRDAAPSIESTAAENRVHSSVNASRAAVPRAVRR